MASYTEDPVWADVTPQPQDDGPNPVCPISYAPEYREAMDYFRVPFPAPPPVLFVVSYSVRPPGFPVVAPYV